MEPPGDGWAVATRNIFLDSLGSNPADFKRAFLREQGFEVIHETDTSISTDRATGSHGGQAEMA